MCLENHLGGGDPEAHVNPHFQEEFHRWEGREREDWEGGRGSGVEKGEEERGEQGD